MGIIATDLSEVLVDCVELKERHAQQYGLELPENCHCTSRDVVERLGLIGKTEWYKFTDWVYTHHFHEAPWMPGAKEMLLEWNRTGTEYMILSSKPPRFKRSAEEIFTVNGLPPPGMEFVGQQEGYEGKSKAQACRERGADMLIDNRLEHLLPAAPYVPHLIHLSRDRESHPAVYTAHSLRDVRMLVKQLRDSYPS